MNRNCKVLALGCVLALVLFLGATVLAADVGTRPAHDSVARRVVIPPAIAIRRIRPAAGVVRRHGESASRGRCDAGAVHSPPRVPTCNTCNAYGG